MTVGTLIEKLSKYNKDAIVCLHHKNGRPVLFTAALHKDEECVWLETEIDVDMREEISARLEQAIEEGTDELDFYGELLELGIDVHIIRRYMGEEAAEHMEIFCREHGLLPESKKSKIKKLKDYLCYKATAREIDLVLCYGEDKKITRIRELDDKRDYVACYGYPIISRLSNKELNDFYNRFGLEDFNLFSKNQD